MSYSERKDPVINMIIEFESTRQAVEVVSMFHNLKFKGKILHVSFSK